MQLQKAVIENCDELVEMNNQLVIDEQFDVILPEDKMIERMKDFIQGSVYDCYLMVHDNVVCGYCLVDTTKTPLYLRHLFVKKEHRRKGLGKKTIQMLLEMYKTDSLDIEVMAWNSNALEFYTSIGFTPRFIGMRITKE
ncbi:MAG TPA: GNAT family N-acetyltransferase [Treponemataceae bacterium]|nr:GNAT family N-acetyltransferase [Treponemataceae bacterium]